MPTGTNLLGLVKHLAGIEMAYFGETFGRPCQDRLPFDDPDPYADMFAAPGESREFITGLYQKAWAHADGTIETLPLTAVGHVPWWPADRRNDGADDGARCDDADRKDDRMIGGEVMTASQQPVPAMRPEDLGKFFLERANAGDVDGVVALYEPGAVLASPAGQLATGQQEIRRVYTQLLAGRPVFSSAGQSPAIIQGDLALTSTRLPGGGATAEVARRQPDGTWRWVIDQPAVLR